MFEKMKGAVARFVDRHLDGSLTLGPLTLDGANALDWRATLRVPALGVTLSLKAPTRKRGWYFYASPNSAPWAAVLGCGPGLPKDDAERIAKRLEVISESPSRGAEVCKLWIWWGVEPVDGSPEGSITREAREILRDFRKQVLSKEVAREKSEQPLRRFTFSPGDN